MTCDLTELPVEMCGCVHHRGAASTERHGSERGPATRMIEARFNGFCAWCDGPVRAGDIIYLRDGDWLGVCCAFI